MTKRLKSVSPLQLGIVAGIFYALFSLIIVPFFIVVALISVIAPHPANQNPMPVAFGVGFGLMMAVLAPIMYGAMGFIFGAFAGLVYNLVAKWTGGIEFVTE